MLFPTAKCSVAICTHSGSKQPLTRLLNISIESMHLVSTLLTLRSWAHNMLYHLAWVRQNHSFLCNSVARWDPRITALFVWCWIPGMAKTLWKAWWSPLLPNLQNEGGPDMSRGSPRTERVKATAWTQEFTQALCLIFTKTTWEWHLLHVLDK